MLRFDRLLVFIGLLISLPAWGQTPADTARANQYYQIADSLSEEGNYQNANLLFRQAQRIYQKAENWERHIACINSIAYNQLLIAAYDSATLLAQRALQFSEQHLGKDHPEAARAYNVLGTQKWYNDELQDALRYYDQGLAINIKQFGEDHSEVIESYGNLGIVYYSKDEYDQAVTYTQKALSISTRILGETDPAVATFSNNLGLIYVSKGEYEKAHSYYQKALTINLNHFGESHPSVAIDYNNLGAHYERKGEYERALSHFQKALSIRLKTLGQTHPNVASDYNNQGVVYYRKGEYEKALSYYQKALAIDLKHFGKSHPSIAVEYNNLGLVYTRMNEYEKALSYYQKALTINFNRFGESYHGVASSYYNIGVVYYLKSEYEEALSYYQEALDIRLKIFGQNHPDIAEIHNNIGTVYKEMGNYEQALVCYKKSLKANASSFQKTTIQNQSSSSDYYLDKLVLLKTLNHQAKIFALLNQHFSALHIYQQADSLLNQLRYTFHRHSDKTTLNHNIQELYSGALQSGWKCYQTTEKDTYRHNLFYLNERSKANLLIDAITVIEARHLGQVPDSLLVQESDLKSQRSFYQSQLLRSLDSTRIQNQLFAINQQHDFLIKQMEKKYPNYHQLKYSSYTATIPSIQSQLSNDEAVVSYFAGDSTRFAFTITRQQYHITSLPTDTLLTLRVQRLRQALHMDSVSHRSYPQLAFMLYEQLFAPIVEDSLLVGINQLTIIPDGALGYLPFDLLLTQPVVADANYRTLPYLMRDYTIRYGYSATWLFHPFARPDRPVQDQYIAFAPSYAAQTDSARQLALGRFRDQVAPLGFNKHEANGIQRHLSGVSLTDRAAVERRFKEEVEDYSVVHLAMHALVDDQQPMYSRLVFSPDATDTLEDGYLHAYELYDMEIPADLAVLSACETGYGKLERGEGIMSLARAFAYAGCPSVVMSHWTVDDAASAQLMDYFYGYLSEGMRKDEALRQAKLRYLENASVQDTNPFFWGNFVVIGDVSPIVDKRPGWVYWLLAGGGLLIVGVIAFLIRSQAKKQTAPSFRNF